MIPRVAGIGSSSVPLSMVVRCFDLQHPRDEARRANHRCQIPTLPWFSPDSRLPWFSSSCRLPLFAPRSPSSGPRTITTMTRSPDPSNSPSPNMACPRVTLSRAMTIPNRDIPNRTPRDTISSPMASNLSTTSSPNTASSPNSSPDAGPECRTVGATRSAHRPLSRCASGPDSGCVHLSRPDFNRRSVAAQHGQCAAGTDCRRSQRPDQLGSQREGADCLSAGPGHDEPEPAVDHRPGQCLLQPAPGPAADRAGAARSGPSPPATCKARRRSRSRTNQGYIAVAPANPEVVYVPTYNPWVVYGQPIAAYPGYQPLVRVGAVVGDGDSVRSELRRRRVLSDSHSVC